MYYFIKCMQRNNRNYIEKVKYMKKLSFLIKPASSSCNLTCRYCFYADVSEHRQMKSNGVMQEDTMQALIDQALCALDDDGELTFAFQGGEPTLAGLGYFRSFTTYVTKNKKAHQKIHYALQTNAMVLNDAWCSFFHEFNFLLGVSLDGYKENHDYFRLTTGSKATYKDVMRAISYLRKHNVPFNILTVLSKQLAKHPKKLYDFYQKQEFAYIQLIPCLAGLDEEKNPFALTPKLFAQFYKQFYAYWLMEMEKGMYRSIGLFDNIIPMFADIPPQQCGMLGSCSLQLVVESDGSIYPCDFYVLDEYKGGNIKDSNLIDIIQSKQMQGFLKEEKTMCSKCATCSFLSICHGNCKRMNSLYFSEDYCGYQEFLTYAYPTIQKIARQHAYRRAEE